MHYNATFEELNIVAGMKCSKIAKYIVLKNFVAVHGHLNLDGFKWSL